MKKRNKILSFLLCGAMALSMAACSSGNTEQESQVSETETTEITFAFWGSTAEKEAIEATCRTFEAANDGIKVNALHIPSGDFLTKLNAMIAAGDTPDISYSDSWNCQFGEDGIIYDYNELMEKFGDAGKDEYLEYNWWNWSPTESCGPIFAPGTVTLLYNKDMFDELNIEYPPYTVENAWSWDKFVEVSQKLTLDSSGKNAADSGFDSNNIKQYGIMFEGTSFSYMPFVYANGGYYLSEDCSEFALNEPSAAQAIQNITDLINVYHVHPSATQKSTMTSPSTAMQSRQIAMYIAGTWNMLDLNEADVNYGVGVLPIDKNYTTYMCGSALVIYKSTQHLEEAYEFGKWMTNPESSEELLNLFQSLWLPAPSEYYENEEKLDLWASSDLDTRPEHFIEAVVDSTLDFNRVRQPDINIKNWSEINTLVSSALDSVWLGDKSAEEALTEVKPKVDELVEGTYNGDRS